MAKPINAGAGVTGIKNLKDKAAEIISAGRAYTSVESVSHFIGLENHGTSGDHAVNVGLESFEQSIAQKLSVSPDGKVITELTPAQIRAGAIIAMAAGDTRAYAAKAASVAFESLGEDEYDVSDSSPAIYGASASQANHIGLEYYQDATVLDTHLAASLTFNVQASRQGPMAEAFFPTITIDPTQCGMLVEVDKTMVFRQVRHALNQKDSSPFKLRNVLDAATDATVLEDESVKFVPYYVDHTADNFIDPALMAVKAYPIGDYDIDTLPLTFDKSGKHLHSLSAHPGLVKSGYLDDTDELDGRLALKNVYIKINKKGAADSDAELISFNTNQLAGAAFNNAPEGDAKDMLLNFRNDRFQISKSTRTVAAAAPATLDELRDMEYKIIFGITVNSNVNLVTGYEEISKPTIRIIKLVDNNNETVDHLSGAGKTLVNSITLEAVGYDYNGTRSNTNRRTKGLNVDTRTIRERVKIQLGSPITTRKPIGTTDNSKSLNALITTARQRNDNLAISKLLNYSAALKEVYASVTDAYDIPTIEGPGRHYVGVWYEEKPVRLRDLVASLDSINVSENLATAILTLLREQIVRAYQESRFQPAMEMVTGYTGQKPKVTIGTDVQLANWLWVKGDVRTLGDQFDFEIVSCNDNRFHGRIQWVFSVGDGQGGFCPLNFGYHLWVPELITDTNLTRNESTNNEITVQPRNYHFVSCPITGVILVEGLNEFLSRKPYISVKNSVVTDIADLDGDLSGLDPNIPPAPPAP